MSGNGSAHKTIHRSVSIILPSTSWLWVCYLSLFFSFSHRTFSHHIETQNPLTRFGLIENNWVDRSNVVDNNCVSDLLNTLRRSIYIHYRLKSMNKRTQREVKIHLDILFVTLSTTFHRLIVFTVHSISDALKLQSDGWTLGYRLRIEFATYFFFYIFFFCIEAFLYWNNRAQQQTHRIEKRNKRDEEEQQVQEKEKKMVNFIHDVNSWLNVSNNGYGEWCNNSK